MKPATFACLLLAALPLAAFAADDKATAPAKSVTAEAAPADAARDPANCLDETATRIKRKEAGCRHPGRVISRKDLERTGEADVGDALRKLDPSLN